MPTSADSKKDGSSRVAFEMESLRQPLVRASIKKRRAGVDTIPLPCERGKSRTDRCSTAETKFSRFWNLMQKWKFLLYPAFAAILVILFQTATTIRFEKEIASGSIAVTKYSSINSQDDLKEISSDLKSLCFPGQEKKCKCLDPMQPGGREGKLHWLKAVQENKDAASSSEHEDADVVFYGDSITEGWKGTSYGFPNGRKDNNLAVYNSLFSLEDGGKYKGLTLGISGDRSVDLLWRLQNGELNDHLNPKVFWLLVGTNDMGNSWCSPEATTIGILRVVEEIRARKPGITIVINAIFPRSFMKNGHVLKKHLGPPGRYSPPLWPAIQAINSQLKEYSDSHEDIEFFDSNDLFFKDDKQLKLNQHLMYDFLHPSSVGYKLW
eukprot:CAMPEP_0194087714 /NCGR_PEP_ID=MMETSP0149-20130528/26263_1 /TAXON_ID=122233 /ORGANISM="Chaetoceros debilis, Strain MM31A-1" /LENGTH=379 /DNA_ID=CAMNT_0038771171 /DNA_START=176 /DNA_END=1312 /DNA_ORIENTATION=-